MKRISIFLLLVISYAATAQVVLNEICPANGDINYDPDYFNFSGWVEVYNAGSSTVNINGYYFSDDVAEPLKWRVSTNINIPAKGFVLIWCDNMNAGRHTSFEMDAEGEDVVLSNASGLLLDKISFPKQLTNISYGRLTNGSGAWAFLSQPTPALANNPATAGSQLEKPNFSLVGGRYASSQQLVLTHSNPQAEIRYTTDGSEPSISSTRFTSSFAISATQIIKAKAFLEGFLPGETETQTYFINEHSFSLPVVSISMKPDYLYNNTIGIYVTGTNGVSGYCNGNAVNWNRDWDRHAVFEYYDKDGKRMFNQSVDVRIGGNCSRNQPQKALVIKARDKYGSNILNYKFFNKSINRFGGLMLRNSGNDFNVTMFRDALMQALPKDQMDVDYMDYQPAIVYLNGAYMGIQNLREKIDADFIESNYSVDKDNLDLIETWDENALEGSPDTWISYRSALASMNRTTPEAYALIDQNIDIQEYINYLVAQIYYANTDWPGNNVKFWRDASVNGKFRWILWDTDFGFDLVGDAHHGTLNFATATDGPGWPNPPWSTEHIRMVLENPVFRERFIQTMNTALNTTFNPDRVIGIINEFQQRVATEMPFHKQRWWGSIGDWNFEVQRLRDFATERNAFMRQHMADFFGMPNSVNISTVVKSGQGKIRMNEIVSEESTAQSYLKNLPVQVEPVPDMGYQFKEWKVTKRESTPVSIVINGSTWKYFDQGSEPVNWKDESFNDAAWAESNAQFGYGEGDEQTVVSYGPNASNKFVTTYFRKTFNLTDTVGLQQLTGSILADDGAVISLNGIEMTRINMPGGTITFSSLAMDAAAEGVHIPFTIPKGIVKPGNNVLAVEIHQNNVTSSDVSFDLALSSFKLGPATTITSAVAARTDIAASDIHYEVYFEPSGITILNDVVINEINTTDSELVDNAGEAEDWIELFNAGTQPVNLVGLYMTDILNNRKKYQLQAGADMILQPGAYKILWADEDVHQGSDHVGFKLSNEGEAVGLYQIVNDHVNILDEVVFQEQLEEGSFSRLPNATGPFSFTHIGTPDAFNEIVTAVDEEISVSTYPNPVQDYLIIESTAVLDYVTLTDSFGRIIQSLTNITQHQLSLHSNPAGIYILRLQSGSRLKTIKILKR